jgi:hypothetical protein
MARDVNEKSAKVYLAAFGKHPGWDDHIDDLGLESDALIAIKRLLYTEGIKANIDSGAWESLDAARGVDRFAHVFVWRRGADVIVGRMWSSTDGKGRARYPMVVCAHVRGAALDWAIREFLPRLEHLEQQCTRTTSASDVRSALDAAREGLRIAFAGAGTRASDSGAAINPVTQLLDTPSSQVNREGLLRILYQIEREMSSFQRVPAAGSTTMRTRGMLPRPQQIRVPAGSNAIDESLIVWMAFISTQLHDAAPILVVRPLEQPWVDLIVGEPEPSQLFCLRASNQAIPLVTEVPFTLDGDFEFRAREFIQKAQANGAVSFATAALAHAGGRERGLLGRLASVFRVMMFGLLWIAVIGVLAVGAWLLFISDSKPVKPPDPVATVATVATPEPPSHSNVAWRRLWVEHESWLKDVLNAAGSDGSRFVVEGDSSWQAALAEITAPAREELLDPWAIIKPLPGLAERQYARSPDARVVEKAQQALEVIDRIRLNIENSTTLKSLDAFKESCQQRQWNTTAAVIAALTKNARPPSHDQVQQALQGNKAFAALVEELNRDVTGSLSRSQAALTSIQSINQDWSAIEQRVPIIKATDDAVLAMMPALLETRLASLPGDDVQAHFSQLSRAVHNHRLLVDRVAEVVQSRWNDSLDREWFAAHSEAHARLRQGVAADQFMIERWAAEADASDFQLPAADADPRLGWKATESLARLNQEMLRLKAPIDPAIASQAQLVSAQRLADVSQLSWNRTNRERIESEVRAVNRELGDLNNLIARAQGCGNETHDVYAQRVKAQDSIAPSGSVVLDARWREKRDALLATVDEPCAEVESLRRQILEIDAAFGASVNFEKRPASFDSAAAMTASTKVREQVLAEGLRTVEGRELDSPRAALEAQIKRLEIWRESALRVAATCQRAEAMLDAGYGLAEANAGDSVESILVAARQEVSFDGLKPALNHLLARVELHEGIARASDKDMTSLAGSFHSGSADIRLAAWRRAGSLESWPRNVDDLRTEIHARQEIERWIATLQLDDAARLASLRQQLTQEMTAQGSARWTKLAERLENENDLASAVELMQAMNVDVHSLPARARHNVLTLQFTKAIRSASDGDDAALRDIVSQFIESAANQDLAPLDSAHVDALLAALSTEVSDHRKPSLDFASIGPATTGWALREQAADQSWVHYGWKNHVLKFARVSGSAAGPSYICTTEMPVGLAIDWLEERNAWPMFASLMPDEASTSGKRGPQGWRWRSNRNRGIVKSKAWIAPDHWPYQRPHYPSTLGQGDQLTSASDNPTPLHPFQNVSASAATLVARLLGCRLETSAEFASAFQQAKGERSEAQYIAQAKPNIRDAVWARQWKYVDEVYQSEGGTIGAVAWPGEAVFWPATTSVGEPRRARQSATIPSDDYSDGQLWFASVSANSTGPAEVVHLLGNAAEFSFDKPDAIEAINPSSADLAGAIRTTLAQSWNDLGVIGGSALSDQDLPRNKPLALPTSGGGKDSYSDVGFRLAFTGRGPTVSRPLKERIGVLISPDRVYLFEQH